VTRNANRPAISSSTSREAACVWKLLRSSKKHGIDTVFGPVAEDFDDLLPEDFLLKPLP